MAWQSVTNWQASDGPVLADVLNDLALDIRTWGDDVDANGNALANLAELRLTPAALPGSPTTGTLVSDSGAANALKFYNGSAWVAISQVNADWNAVSGVAQILNKPTLATVATSGAYSDLTGKPMIGPQWVDGGSSKIYYSAGNVGIGIAAPVESLHVAGAIKAGGPATTNAASTITLDYQAGFGDVFVNGPNVSTVPGFKIYLQRSDGTGQINPLQISATGGVCMSAIPTSSAGLASGYIWRDAANGNVLKMVP